MKNTKNLTTNTCRAIAKYGIDTCLKAAHENIRHGEGARTIGIYLGLTTNQANAAINAGRELMKNA